MVIKFTNMKGRITEKQIGLFWNAFKIFLVVVLLLVLYFMALDNRYMKTNGYLILDKWTGKTLSPEDIRRPKEIASVQSVTKNTANTDTVMPQSYNKIKMVRVRANGQNGLIPENRLADYMNDYPTGTIFCEVNNKMVSVNCKAVYLFFVKHPNARLCYSDEQ